MRSIGILGGMGPAAGLHLQQLIQTKTPATCDQEHIPIVHYSSSDIPDRTTAIKEGSVDQMAASVVQALLVLERSGVSEIFIPCNTSFVAYDTYARAVSAPIFHLPNATLAACTSLEEREVLLLATEGTYLSGVYESSGGVTVLYPERALLQTVQLLIRSVKEGDVYAQQDIFSTLIQLLGKTDLPLILGCTELSVLARQFRLALPQRVCIDPLEIASDYAVSKYMTSPVVRSRSA